VFDGISKVENGNGNNDFAEERWSEWYLVVLKRARSPGHRWDRNAMIRPARENLRQRVKRD
jgi:hypothetical protein